MVKLFGMPVTQLWITFIEQDLIRNGILKKSKINVKLRKLLNFETDYH